MKRIGIIVAMQEELEEIKEYVEDINEKEIRHITFIEGKVEEKNVVLVQCGIGKVNAAMVTQALIDSYNIEYIVNIGVAGALNPMLNIGDVVIADKLIQHDFDITAFGHSKGYITGVGDFIQTDENLKNKLEKLNHNNKDNDYKIKLGIIASGDIFCTDIEMKNKIYSKFDADCVEMEGAAIAQVCYLNEIPFVVMRSISDSPNGKNAITFDKFLKIASKRIANLLVEFIKEN
ncbi:5'-methylthioadenosine/S-adenosylhomocysteine nucleosidase [Clostridium sp. CAG:575]|nr:5'-methylthioadenosine/S-adenosylhomocysteine nucleosidase [Clostridium sp. CAG:575]